MGGTKTRFLVAALAVVALTGGTPAQVQARPGHDGSGRPGYRPGGIGSTTYTGPSGVTSGVPDDGDRGTGSAGPVGEPSRGPLRGPSLRHPSPPYPFGRGLFGGFGPRPAGGTGPAPAGGGPKGPVPIPDRSQRRGILRSATVSSGLPYPDDQWENWWLLNQDQYLDLNRRFAARAPSAEPNGDIFLGAIPISRPISRHRPEASAAATPVLRALIDHPSALVRGEACLALGKVGGGEDVELLTRCLLDSSRTVRQRALLALGLTRSERAMAPLINVLRSTAYPDADRAHAALGLALVGETNALQWLLPVLADEGTDRALKASLLYALGFIDHEHARRVLGDHARDSRNAAPLRAVAVLALGKHSNLLDVPRFEGFLGDPDVHVRRSAALALGQQSFNSPQRLRANELRSSGQLDRLRGDARRLFGEMIEAREKRALEEEVLLSRRRTRSVRCLVSSLERDGDRMVRNFAAISLGRLKDPVAKTALLREFKASGAVSSAGFLAMAFGVGQMEEAAPELRRSLVIRSENPSTRAALCLAAGMIGDREAGRLMLEIATGRSESSRAAAAVGCGLLGDQGGAKERLRVQVSRRNQPYLRPSFALSLALLGDVTAIAGLRTELEMSGSSEDRILGAQALGVLRDLDSLDALLAAVVRHDGSDASRAVILHAIGQVAEKTELPGLEPLRRDWNYLLGFPILNEAILN